ncbi:hypothetical protein NQ318_002505 [Aromia moschata]|uniref:Uncharacterized protein n=1 Tax=Aromia moschata TaxID=1265417 RepID=A0AAV8Y9M4_9CUCU|nr:hypothetical protein NQ318_002505 [Aromia moschata]
MLGGINTSTSENRLSLNLSGPGEFLPRIAEEKDSPTNGQETKQEKCDKNLETSKMKVSQENSKRQLKTGFDDSSRGNNDKKANICDKNLQSEIEKDKQISTNKPIQKDCKTQLSEATINSKTKCEVKAKRKR